MRMSSLDLVEKRLIVELKSVEVIKGIHQAQLLTYLIPLRSSCPSWYNWDTIGTGRIHDPSAVEKFA
jgi:hypothetical protein